MKFLGITPVHEFDGKFVKREDLAYWTSLEYPSGSKVRQYMEMAALTVANEGYAPCLVGCSANSAMAIYVASTAKILGTKGIIYTAKRKVRSASITYALSLGAEVNEMTSKQGHYLQHLQRHARQRAIDLKQYVEWDRKAAIKDTMEQCENVAEQVIRGIKPIKRIIVPTGSGLTAAGVILGLTWCGLGGRPECPTVTTVATSPMATVDSIMKLVKRVALDYPMAGSWFTKLEFIGPSTPYDTPVIESLPDGTPLDPYYAAKAWKYVEKDDLFWPVGLRPIISMPEICQREFKDWKGPQKAIMKLKNDR